MWELCWIKGGSGPKGPQAASEEGKMGRAGLEHTRTRNRVRVKDARRSSEGGSKGRGEQGTGGRAASLVGVLFGVGGAPRW